jgi:hypothetical protein
MTRRFPASTSARGYGAAHQRLRRTLAPYVAAGVASCASGGIILPGERWDLGHVDGRRDQYAGVEHRSCNRATARHRREREDERW